MYDKPAAAGRAQIADEDQVVIRDGLPHSMTRIMFSGSRYWDVMDAKPCSDERELSEAAIQFTIREDSAPLLTGMSMTDDTLMPLCAAPMIDCTPACF